MKRALHIVKEVISDTGVGFATGGALLFATSNPLGLAATAFCATASAAIKYCHVAQPRFMQKNTKLTRLIKDPRTPLRMLGCAMLTVTGSTLAASGLPLMQQVSSVSAFISLGASTVLLPAFAGLVFAAVDFIFAKQLGEAKTGQPATPKEKSTNKYLAMAKLAATRPETYMAMGFACVGLMSGPLSVIAFPLVASAYLTGMHNIIKDKPVHNGYSNLQYAGAQFCFGIVSLMQGNVWMAASNFLNLPYLAKLQAELTPGGEPTMRKDIKAALKNLATSLRIRRNQILPMNFPAIPLEISLAPESIYTTTRVATLPTLSGRFGNRHEIGNLQTGTAHQRAIDILNMQNSGGIVGLDRTAV